MRRRAFQDDCDAWEDYRAMREAEQRTEREALYAVLRAARRHYPHNALLRKRWVRAKLALAGCKPKVRIGCDHREVRFYRSMREAGISA